MIISALKRNVSRFLTLPWMGRFITLIRPTVLYHGVRMDLRNPYMPDDAKAAVFWNLYESAEARLISRWLMPDHPVVELGASLGVISRLIHSRIRQPLICVEANPSLIPSIRYNLDSSQKHPFLIIQRAISYAGRQVSFSWKAGKNLTGKVDSSGQDTVESITLTEIVEENDLRQYALIMDIEGSEIEILKKDLQALRTCGLIIAELHACTYGGERFSVHDLDELVRAAGFDLLSRDGNCFAYRRARN